MKTCRQCRHLEFAFNERRKVYDLVYCRKSLIPSTDFDDFMQIDFDHTIQYEAIFMMAEVCPEFRAL